MKPAEPLRGIPADLLDHGGSPAHVEQPPVSRLQFLLCAPELERAPEGVALMAGVARLLRQDRADPAATGGDTPRRTRHLGGVAESAGDPFCQLLAGDHAEVLLEIALVQWDLAGAE